jgi:hypothetical protein
VIAKTDSSSGETDIMITAEDERERKQHLITLQKDQFNLVINPSSKAE